MRYTITCDDLVIGYSALEVSVLVALAGGLLRSLSDGADRGRRMPPQDPGYALSAAGDGEATRWRMPVRVAPPEFFDPSLVPHPARRGPPVAGSSRARIDSLSAR